MRRNAELERLTDSLYELAGAAVVLVVLVAVAVWLVFWLRARYGDRDDAAAPEHGLLSHLGDLHREGGLSDEEYRSIKRRLVERLDQPGADAGKPGSG